MRRPSRGRSRRSAPPRARRRTSCRASSTPCAPMRRWVRCATRSGRSGASTKKCPSSEGQRLRKLRVVIAKPGLDGHDRGAKVIARALRDAGMEVIYTGLRQTPEMIAEAALQEDVDVIGLSILSGAHMALTPRLLELMKKNGQSHVKVFVGGIIPDEDLLQLKEMGVTGIYGPGSSTEDIIRDVKLSVAG